MKKKIVAVLLALVLLAGLTACAVFNSAGTDQSAASGNTRGQQFEPASMPVEMKLAIGTLKLEGTQNAVTAEQAKNLLPLRQALKSISTSDNAAQEEINALYTQIEESMSADQVKAIEDLTWTQEDLAALRETYGIQSGGPGGPGGNRPTVSADQRSTMQAQFQASGGQGGRQGGGPSDGGGFGGGGGMPPDGGGMPMDGGGGFPGGQGQAQGTPQADSTPSAAMLNRQAMGFNSLFADAVITLLKERAGV
jgi:uncharacterized membrane protein YgcG